MKLNLDFVQDIYLRENLQLVQDAFNDVVFTKGDYQFFEFDIKGSQTNFVLYHNLGFTPQDIIVTKATGNSFSFNYTKFTDNYIVIETTGDVYLRCYIGSMKGNNVGGQSAFASIGETIPDIGSAGGGNLNFYKTVRVIDNDFLINRIIVIGHAPIQRSETISLNGLEIDIDDYVITGNVITFLPSISISLSDKIHIKYAA